MSRCIRQVAGVAAGAVLLASGGAVAQEYDPGSLNTIVRDIDVTFTETDYGKLVEIVYDLCNAGDNTVMFNGPYRRVANYARTSGNGKNANILGDPVDSVGDARLDYVVYHLKNVEGNGTKTADVFAGDVLLQLGIDMGSVSGPVLSADVLLGTNSNGDSTITVTDTSPPTQILDAGRDTTAGIEVGGPDAVMVIKNGTPKTADLICDMNMWYLTQNPPQSKDDFEYGVSNFVISNNTANSVMLFWAAGPSGMESADNIATVNEIFNPPGSTPVRDEEGVYQDPNPSDNCPPPDPSDPTGATFLPLDPSLSCIGDAWTREEGTDIALGKYQRFFGDSSKPVNITAFNQGYASYCDPTEPTPDPLGTDPVTGAENAGPSGNACNRNRGLSGGPSVTITSTLEENTGVWIQTDEGWIYITF